MSLRQQSALPKSGACQRAPPVRIRPVLTHAARESRGLPFAQASLNLFRHKIDGCNRIVGRVLRAEIVPWKFAKNSRPELVRGSVGLQFVQLHSCPQRTGRVSLNPTDFAIYCLAQLVGEFDTFRSNEDMHESIFRCRHFQISCRIRVERRSESDVCIHMYFRL